MTSVEQFPGEFQAGDLVGGAYRIIGYLGRGAMGHVYHVRHEMLNAEYALKTLSSDKVNELAWLRFQNEAQAIARLHHPNIVGIHNLGMHDDRVPFYAMDLLQGMDLGERLGSEGPLEIKDAVRIFIEVCAGISFAHKQGIIHRDIKPGNIFLLKIPGAAGETVKVVDFGIAKLSSTKEASNQALTAVGDVVGTPFYMSPEQCMGERVDARSDIYSLGCTLFESLTGSLPFRASSPTETMLLHQSAPPPSLNKASAGKEFPASLEYVVATTLAKQQSERYQTMDQLSLALAAVLEDDKPVTVIPGGALVAVASTTAQKPAVVLPGQRGLPGKRRALLAGSVLACLLVCGSVAYWLGLEVGKKAPHSSLNDPTHMQPSADLSGKGRDDSGVLRKDFEKQAAALQNAKSADALDSNGPFSTIFPINGASVRCFDFPDQPVIGRIRDWYVTRSVPATGLVKFPEASYLTFIPSAVVGSDPDLLKRFRFHEIYAMEFVPGADSPEMLKAALKIQGLQELDFSQSWRLAKPDVDILKQFHDLEWFDGSPGITDGALLAQAKCWGNMQGFFLPHSKHLSPLLKELQTSNRLERLGLGPSDLNSQDYKLIATRSKLWYLDLHGNPVTNGDLKILGALHELTTLDLLNSDLDLGALGTLKQFKKLKSLYISSPRLSAADFQKIKAALPQAHPKQTKE